MTKTIHTHNSCKNIFSKVKEKEKRGKKKEKGKRKVKEGK
jgi:hypothetical protein